MGSRLIGSCCGVKWGAEASAVTWSSVIGGHMNNDVEGSSGIAGFREEVGHPLLLGGEVIKVNPCSGEGFNRGRDGVLNRVRGAVLIFILCKLFLESFADIVGDGGFLEPGLDISKRLLRES